MWHRWNSTSSNCAPFTAKSTRNERLLITISSSLDYTLHLHLLLCVYVCLAERESLWLHGELHWLLLMAFTLNLMFLSHCKQKGNIHCNVCRWGWEMWSHLREEEASELKKKVGKYIKLSNECTWFVFIVECFMFIRVIHTKTLWLSSDDGKWFI